MSDFDKIAVVVGFDKAVAGFDKAVVGSGN